MLGTLRIRRFRSSGKKGNCLHLEKENDILDVSDSGLHEYAYFKTEVECYGLEEANLREMNGKTRLFIKGCPHGLLLNNNCSRYWVCGTKACGKTVNTLIGNDGVVYGKKVGKVGENSKTPEEIENPCVVCGDVSHQIRREKKKHLCNSCARFSSSIRYGNTATIEDCSKERACNVVGRNNRTKCTYCRYIKCVEAEVVKNGTLPITPVIGKAKPTPKPKATSLTTKRAADSDPEQSDSKQRKLDDFFK